MSCPTASICEFHYLKIILKVLLLILLPPLITITMSHDTDGGKGRKTSDIKRVLPKEMHPGIQDFSGLLSFFQSEKEV